MQPPSAGARREALEWLARAERDLQVCANELTVTPPLPEMTAYHAQQAAEKALKAYLTLNGVPFRHTHNLLELLTQCQALDASFAQLSTAAQMLNPYSTQFRYPGGPLAPPEPEARQALRLAGQIVGMVRPRI
jgi:HEPN domain-containing protein